MSLVSSAPLLAGQSTPLCSPQGLTHVGTLNPADKKSVSHEGQGLSVSQHPSAWGRIARLGSGEVWSVGRADAQFLDYHQLTEEQVTAIADWGVARGYVERQPVFMIHEYDSELDEYRSYTTTSVTDVEAAQKEFDDFGDEDEPLRIEETTALVTTALFPDKTVKAGETGQDQILATLWVAEEAPLIDGVWWQDPFDPVALSAPRGVIAMARIAEWIESAAPHDGQDKDEYDDDGWPLCDDEEED